MMQSEAFALERRLVPALLCLLVAAGCTEAPSWREGSFEEALSAARTQEAPLLVDVYAGWCPPCRALDEQVWETEEGATLTEELVAWKVDFDTSEGQAFKRRYNILGLPTVLFLRPDGEEIDRIEGYSKRDEFLAQARRYARGESRLEEARAGLENRPSDPEARLLLGRLLLVRGREAEALPLMRAAAEDAATAPEALFLLGRYYTRAAEKPLEGAVYWRRLHRDHRESPWGGGALYWVLKSWEDAGQLEDRASTLADGTLLIDGQDYATAVSYLRSAGHDETASALLREGLEAHPRAEVLLELETGDA